MNVQKWAGDRVGLLMILVTLLVIGTITGVLYTNNKQQRMDLVQSQASGLARLLSSMPFDALIKENRGSNSLQLINSQKDPNFAYTVLVDTSGAPLASITANGVLIPEQGNTPVPSLWVTEHRLRDSARNIIEFRAPLMDAGTLAGQIRVGYFEPGYWPDRSEISLIATLALPIFLLVPFFYLLFRREMRPLRAASQEIEDLLQSRQLQTMKLDSSGEFSDFIGKFNQFVSMVSDRMETLNQQNSLAQESSLVLTYQRRRIESALQCLPDAVIVMDESGKTTFANAMVESILGIESGKIIGHLPHQWCDNKEVVSLLARYHSNVTRLRRSESFEFTPASNPGKSIAVSAYPLFTPKDRDDIFGTLVVFHDNTEAKLASQARDEFIGHVAHELKSPLNVIHMYAENLLEAHEDPQARIDTINVINDEIERLAQLISNLLSITKIEAGSIALNKQRVKLGEFIEDTFNSISRSGKSDNLTFNLNLPRSLGAVQIDKDLMRIALNNFLSNAVKYNKPGGSVSLEVLDEDDRYTICISDTGIGISAEDAGHIFEKFYRADSDDVRARNGHGLGLALAREIIELHHGSVSLDTSQAQGSTFNIFINKSSSFIKEAV